MSKSLLEWIKGAEDTKQQHFREVVHIILNAIAYHLDHHYEMIMKGGILMAIKYNTGRNTTDIDFSTTMHYAKFKDGKDEFIKKLENAIQLSQEKLDYGIYCVIQKKELKPKQENYNFQTLCLTIGYGLKSNAKAMKRLMNKSHSQIVRIDYSFNENIGGIDFLDQEKKQIKIYSGSTLVAEKFRSILQQVTRNRNRRQDIYDLYKYLNVVQIDDQEKKFILERLIATTESRDINANKESMNEEIRKYSSKDYNELQNEITEKLPCFDVAFDFICDFYRDLPWQNLSNAPKT